MEIAGTAESVAPVDWSKGWRLAVRVIATILCFMVAGTAFTYWTMPDHAPPTADQIAADKVAEEVSEEVSRVALADLKPVDMDIRYVEKQLLRMRLGEIPREESTYNELIAKKRDLARVGNALVRRLTPSARARFNKLREAADKRAGLD